MHSFHVSVHFCFLIESFETDLTLEFAQVEVVLHVVVQLQTKRNRMCSPDHSTGLRC